MKFYHVLDGPPLYTNCFLLIGSDGKAAVVDPAAPVSSFEKILQEERATLTNILLTHAHFDHIGSVEALRKKYGAKLVMNRGDADFFGLEPDRVYTDGGVVKVGEMEFTTIFTPGHTPGSTCLLCGDYLFTGDTLFAGDIGRTDLPGGNSADMAQSLQKLCKVVRGNPEIWPGHEESSTMEEEKKNNVYLQF